MFILSLLSGYCINSASLLFHRNFILCPVGRTGEAGLSPFEMPIIVIISCMPQLASFLHYFFQVSYS